MTDDEKNILSKKLKRVPAPVLQQAANELRDVAENIDKLAYQQIEKIEARRRSSGYRKRMQAAQETMWNGLEDGLDYPAALTQAAFAYNVEPDQLELVWPSFQKKKLRRKDEERMRRVMVLWRAGQPIAEIARLESVTERTINRIVKQAREMELKL